MYNVVPFDVLRLFGIVTLGAAAVSSVFSWIVSFIQFWRYLFFPTKENFLLFCENLVNLLLVSIQAIVYLYQANQLAKEEKKVQYRHAIYRYAVAILFFHDFYYGAILYNVGTWYEFFGFTQFIVHTVMMFLPDPQDMEDKRVFKGFVGVWALLIVQHLLTVIFGFTDPALADAVTSDNTPLRYIVWWLVSVYLVVDTIFLLNAAVVLEVDAFKPIRPWLSKFNKWWETSYINRAAEKYILSKPKGRRLI